MAAMVDQVRQLLQDGCPVHTCRGDVVSLEEEAEPVRMSFFADDVVVAVECQCGYTYVIDALIVAVVDAGGGKCLIEVGEVVGVDARSHSALRPAATILSQGLDETE